jgi:hypothetical protein
MRRRTFSRLLGELVRLEDRRDGLFAKVAASLFADGLLG